MTGETLGHYEILESLGAGGMGEVYRARDTKLDRDVAIKVLRTDLAEDPERLARFEREAKAVAAVDHPNIVTVYSVEEADGLRFIAMQLVEGSTLSNLLPTSGFALEELLRISTPIAEAVAAAHERGITHRDLKPSNIMVGNDGRVSVLDFGLAKLADEPTDAEEATLAATAQDADLTEEGKVLGTVAYMSPEQAEGKAVDQRSDVFALGIILFEMATGERPFTGDTKLSVMSSIVKEKPPSITKLNRRLPRHLGRIVNKCLEKDPSRRYQSALGLRNDLEELDRELESGELDAWADTAAAGGAAGRGLARTAVAALVIGVVAIAGWWMLPEHPDATIRLGETIAVTRDADLEVHPAISPDGRAIAYAAGPSWGMLKIYLRQVSGGPAVPLTEDFPGVHGMPAWSPDGDWIAFVADGKIWRIPYLGGEPRVLVEPPEGMMIEYGVTFAPGGESIAYVATPTVDNPGEQADIYRVPVDGGDAAWLGEAFGPHSLAWSPDGQTIAFVSQNGGFVTRHNIANSSLWTIPAEGGDPKPLTGDDYLDMSPVWTPDSRSVFFISNRGGSQDVYSLAVGADGAARGEPTALTSGLALHGISITTDGSRLAYSTVDATTQNIWSVPIPQGGALSVADAEQVTYGNQMIEGITVSPDGVWLAYDSSLSGNQEIYKVRLDGGNPIPLTDHPQHDFMPDFSPDGRQLVFYSFRTGDRELYTMSADGGSATRLTENPAEDRYPDWSRDDKVVFHSDRTGRQELWVVDVHATEPEGGSATQVTRDGGQGADWSPTGERIAFVAGSDIMLIAADGSNPQPPISIPGRQLRQPLWSDDGTEVYFRVFSPNPVDAVFNDIWAVPATGGEPRLLMRLDDPRRPGERTEWATGAGRLFFTLTEHEADISVLELSGPGLGGR